MAQIIRMRRRPSSGVPLSILFFAGVGALLVVLFAFHWNHQFDAKNPNSPVIIGAPQIDVIDGDTVRANGQVYRLVGFNTPESGLQAKCEAERKLAARATSRLRQIVAAGGLRFERVACACPPGTEGTQRCNYGRLCAKLASPAGDVGRLLIAEGLARPYVCSNTRCPPRRGWC